MSPKIEGPDAIHRSMTIRIRRADSRLLVFSFAPLTIFFLDLFYPRFRFFFHPFPSLAPFILLLIGLFLLGRSGISNAHTPYMIDVERKRKNQ